MEDNIFNEDNLVQNNWIKFSVIGDSVFGTLVAVREMQSRLPGKEKELVKVYEIKADGGEFHDVKDKKILETPVKITAGEYWNVGGGFMIDNSLRNVKVGTKIGIKYTDDRPAKIKGFNDMKIKKVYIKKDASGQPLMDQDWLKDNTQLEEMF